MLSISLAPLAELLLLPDPPPALCLRNKTLHLIRHAQGTHNAAEAEAAASRLHLLDPTGRHAELHAAHGEAWVLLEEATARRHWDAPLTPAGREQAYALRRSLRAAALRLDGVVSSPFRRTLQTALLALPQLEQAATAFQLGADSLAPPPITATDLVRERVGPYTCDGRLTVAELKAIFPAPIPINFSHVENEDRYFAEHPESGPQEDELVERRANAALEWIMALPDHMHRLALVTHLHFLEALARLHPKMDQRRFLNAEHRVVILCETASQRKLEL
ncbi:hypothetical protein AB1Y20_018418 [Prymnesium parvum]|uniref:Uncharacterized protein n=1 Tax=Prymnesium parvum TaxID=97485 RepID=A0AB34JRV4_PRYPA